MPFSVLSLFRECWLKWCAVILTKNQIVVLRKEINQ